MICLSIKATKTWEMQRSGCCFPLHVLLKPCGAADGTQSFLHECVQCESGAWVRTENQLCFPVYV